MAGGFRFEDLGPVGLGVAGQVLDKQAQQEIITQEKLLKAEGDQAKLAREAQLAPLQNVLALQELNIVRPEVIEGAGPITEFDTSQVVEDIRNELGEAVKGLKGLDRETLEEKLRPRIKKRLEQIRGGVKKLKGATTLQPGRDIASEVELPTVERPDNREVSDVPGEESEDLIDFQNLRVASKLEADLLKTIAQSDLLKGQEAFKARIRGASKAAEIEADSAKTAIDLEDKILNDFINQVIGATKATKPTGVGKTSETLLKADLKAIDNFQKEIDKKFGALGTLSQSQLRRIMRSDKTFQLKSQQALNALATDEGKRRFKAQFSDLLPPPKGGTNQKLKGATAITILNQIESKINSQLDQMAARGQAPPSSTKLLIRLRKEQIRSRDLGVELSEEQINELFQKLKGKFK